MKKPIMIILALIMLAGAIFVSYSLTSQKNSPLAEQEEVITAFANTSKEYTVKEFNDKVAIFATGEGSPDLILDVYVFTLPEADRKMLSAGFRVSKSEITGVIEDYTG